jgi:hypothetical protein
VKGAAGTATEVACIAVTRLKDGFSALPGINQLQGVGEEVENSANSESLKQAAERAKAEAMVFEKTIR